MTFPCHDVCVFTAQKLAPDSYEDTIFPLYRDSFCHHDAFFPLTGTNLRSSSWSPTQSWKVNEQSNAEQRATDIENIQQKNEKPRIY